MRCPDCNKFVSNEENEPEVESVEYNEGSVTASVRIVNACADCGTELTEATFEMEASVVVPPEHTGEGHEISAEETGCKRTSRSGYYDKRKGVWVDKFGRYAKTLYGASVDVRLTCSCGAWEEDVTLSDEIEASGMDSLV